MIEIIRDNWLLLLIGQYPNGPVGGLAMTVILAISGLILALPCALGLALARLSRHRSVRLPATAVVQIVRGTPVLMVVFWSYFALPMLIGDAIPGFITLIGALVIYESAYLAEVIRSSILALPRGQTEAARSLGLGYWRTMAYVVLPQALHNALPSLLSQFVSLIKDTSLGYIISVNEFTFAAAQVNNTLLTKPVQVFSILAITYFLLCFSLTQSARVMERRMLAKRSMRGTAMPAREALATESLP
ncbi:amino acid ABC transporter permease [Xanthobacter versatilis]|uniref:amino acid ABC transporter permease n=1 Tax=Xanthobacter autotrophicus (strain ATCC BAA-1158 / Py2) TaxID=78245 RepID=UPI0037292D87